MSLTVLDVAREYGVDNYTASEILRKHRVPIDERWGQVNVDKFLSMYKPVFFQPWNSYPEKFPSAKAVVKNNNRYHWGFWAKGLLRDCRKRRNNLGCDITETFLLNKLEKLDYRCEITGIELERKSGTQKEWNMRKASVDRINNDKGYTTGNVRIVCLGVNLAISTFPLSWFDEMCMARVGVLND